MYIKTNFLLIIAALMILSAKLNAQNAGGLADNEIIALHPKIGGLMNFYSSDFSSFQGAVDCGIFKSGNGLGFSGNMAIEIPLFEKTHLSIALGYIDRSGTLTVENITPALDSTQMIVVDVNTDNSIDAVLGYFEIQPDIRYTLSDNFINGPLRAVGGLRMGFPLQSSFVQKEEINSPSNAVFIVDSKRTQSREITSGDISSISGFAAGLSFGIENLLIIGDNLHFTQQLLFDYNFTDICTDVSWNTYGVRLEAGIRFGITKQQPVEIPETPEPPVIDTIAETPVVTLQMIIQAEIKDVELVVNTGDELLATLPLVNAVFFDKNSAEIPTKYVTNYDGLPSFFYGDAIEKHYYVLPRLAQIVKLNPEAKIIIEGATSGSDNEPEGKQLAEQRAENIKNAFIALEVPADRISTVGRLKPQNPSNQEYQAGTEENQRADIYVQNAPLQEYVSFQRFREVQGQYIVASLPEMQGTQQEKIEIVTSLPDEKRTVYKTGEEIFEVKSRTDNEEEKIVLTAEVHHDGTYDKASHVVDLSTLNTIQLDPDVSRFDAILRFDYNSSELSSDNKGLLKQMTDILPEGATITIFGSADALGSEQRNVQLARERAAATQNYIKKVSGGKFNIQTASNEEKFEETTPQGRFLNRSIKVKVEY